MGLNLRDSNLTCKLQNKSLNVREMGGSGRVEKKMVPSLLLLSCESSVSVKENPDRKKGVFVDIINN